MYCIEPIGALHLFGFMSQPSEHHSREGHYECPAAIAKILERRGWCQTDDGWSNEKIFPVHVTWKEAVDMIYQ